MLGQPKAPRSRAAGLYPRFRPSLAWMDSFRLPAHLKRPLQRFNIEPDTSSSAAASSCTTLQKTPNTIFLGHLGHEGIATPLLYVLSLERIRSWVKRAYPSMVADD